MRRQHWSSLEFRVILYPRWNELGRLLGARISPLRGCSPKHRTPHRRLDLRSHERNDPKRTGTAGAGLDRTSRKFISIRNRNAERMVVWNRKLDKRTHYRWDHCKGQKGQRVYRRVPVFGKFKVGSRMGEDKMSEGEEAMTVYIISDECEMDKCEWCDNSECCCRCHR